MRPRIVTAILATVMLGACTLQGEPPTLAPGAANHELTTQAEDGVTVFGTSYFADLSTDAPLIVLFHQGGSNGRAEYAPLIPWLNAEGYRAIAWDLRAGGDWHGGKNRTAIAMLPKEAQTYCEAYADIEVALEESLTAAETETAIVWGSSFSATLVFQLAAAYPSKISHVISASPASGPPMGDCQPTQWLDQLQSPALVLRPGSEMKSERVQQQKRDFEAYGLSVHVIENGVHGSSMFVDERTESDMAAARQIVIDWLSQ